MQLIHNILSFNQILTVSLLGWLVAQLYDGSVGRRSVRAPHHQFYPAGQVPVGTHVG